MQENDALTARVERLEAQNRRLRALGAVALLGVAAIFLLGQSSSPRLVAEEFVLVDNEGRTRATLAFAPLDYPSLSLMDTDGSIRLRAGLWDNGRPELTMMPKAEENEILPPDGMLPPNIEIGLYRNSSWPRLVMAHDGGSSIELNLDDPDDPAMSLHGTNGFVLLGYRERRGLTMEIVDESEGSPAIYLGDDGRRPVAVFGGLSQTKDLESAKGQIGLQFIDEEGKTSWSAP